MIGPNLEKLELSGTFTLETKRIALSSFLTKNQFGNDWTKP
jgi:hypothetical protein